MSVLDLETFVKTSERKGYTRSFVTKEAYPDKLGKSISRFLEASEKERGISQFEETIPIRTYIEWSDTHNPYTDCVMYLKCKTTFLKLTEWRLKEETDIVIYLLKRLEFKDNTTATVPTVKEVLYQLMEKHTKQITQSKQGFRI